MNFDALWNDIIDFFDKGWWQNIIVSLGSFFFGYFVSWYKRNSFFILYSLRKFKALFIRKKYILIWNDHNIDTSENIITMLKDRNPNYRYRCLKEPEKLLNYPLFPQNVHLVILIVSDVTKLSETEKKRDQIQLKLLKYVRKGGTLFGTHDIIYRRCRNKALQEAFGCEVCNFQRVSEPIQVSIEESEKEHPLLTDLPSSFEVEDGELCWGDWISDAKILIRTKKKFSNNTNKASINVPTLVVRHTGEIGTLIWLNSADKNEKLSRSLSEPQAKVIKIFENAIRYSSEIKTYYISHT